MRAPAFENQAIERLVRHQNRIDHVDHTVRLNHVRNRNRRSSTLLVGKNQLAAVHHRRQRAALDRGQRSFTAAHLDLLGNVLRGHFARDYVVGKNLLQGGKIFRLQKRIHGTCGQLIECLVEAFHRDFTSQAANAAHPAHGDAALKSAPRRVYHRHECMVDN